MQGRVKFKMCSHGVIKIDDYEFTGDRCKECGDCVEVEKTFATQDLTPRFNQGLGCVTNGTRHAEKIAKEKGLIPIGDATMKQVAKQHWGDHPLTKGL